MSHSPTPRSTISSSHRMWVPLLVIFGVAAVLAPQGMPQSIAVRADAAANERIAFETRPGGVTTANTDGSQRKILGPGADPAFSPHGAKIAFVRWRGRIPNIWVMNSDGSRPRQLARNGYAPAWSNDGRKIAYVSVRTLPAPLMVMNPDGSGKHRLYFSSPSGNPSWAPNGKRIAFEGRDDHIWVGTSGGTSARRVSPVFGEAPDWSPDGRRIVFVRAFRGMLYVMKPDGSGLKRLTNSGSDGWPAWSADGTQIIFSRKQRSWDIYVINADGSGLRRITTGPANELTPDWQAAA